MKNIVFFIPAIFFTIFYGWVALNGIGSIDAFVIVWLFLFWIAGILLSKNIFGGGIPGLIPGFYFIYLSTQSNGQPINIERPLGIIILLYYVICIFCVYKKNTSKRKS